jgi:hypothetical protein
MEKGTKRFSDFKEEIIKTDHDMSIFAWRASPGNHQEYMGILAPSPKRFVQTTPHRIVAAASTHKAIILGLKYRHQISCSNNF